MNIIPILLIPLLAACAPAPEVSDSVPGPLGSPAEHVGIVRVVGSAPVNVRVILQPESGSGIHLTGTLAEELRRLAGVEVAVTGELSPSPDPIVDRQLEAASYRILAIDGQPVVMGEIVSVTATTARLRTEDGEELSLSGIPMDFRPGQKVWVQGPQSVVVQSYGMLRP